MKSLRVALRIVFYKVSTDWVAHCLEFDLMGHGRTKDTARLRLVEAITLQVEASAHYKNPSNLFHPAPGKYFAMFAAGKNIDHIEMNLVSDSIIIDDSEAREFVARKGDLVGA